MIFKQQISLAIFLLIVSISATAADNKLLGGIYQPVKSSDTLGSIAKKIRTEDLSLTKYQVMVVIWQNNLASFINGNINRIKLNSSLNIPTSKDIKTIKKSEAKKLFFRAVNGKSVTTKFSATDTSKTEINSTTIETTTVNNQKTQPSPAINESLNSLNTLKKKHEILQEKYQLLSNKQTQYEKNISKLVKNLKENIQTLLDQKTQLKEKNDLKIDKQNKIITQLVNKNKSHNQNVLGLEQTVQQLKKDNSQLLQQQSIQNKTMQNSNENKKAFTVLKQELSNKEFLINILTGCIILLILLQLFMKSKHNSRRKRQPLQQENPNIETFKVAQLVDLDQNHQVEQDLLDNKKITIDDEKIELQLRFNFDVNTVHH